MAEATIRKDDAVVVGDEVFGDGGTMMIRGLLKWKNETGARLEV